MSLQPSISSRAVPRDNMLNFSQFPDGCCDKKKGAFVSQLHGTDMVKHPVNAKDP